MSTGRHPAFEAGPWGFESPRELNPRTFCGRARPGEVWYQARLVSSPGLQFSVSLRANVAPSNDPIFAVAPSAYEARTMIAQIFGVEPGRVALELCPEGFRPPRDALIYRLERGDRPLGERWVLYRG